MAFLSTDVEGVFLHWLDKNQATKSNTNVRQKHNVILTIPSHKVDVKLKEL